MNFLDYDGLAKYNSKIKQIFASGSTMDITLLLSNWNEFEQTIQDQFFKKDDDYLYFIVPDYSSSDTYMRASIRPKDITEDNKLIFTCTKLPDSDITVHIACLEV